MFHDVNLIKSSVIHPNLQATYLESTLINTYNSPRLANQMEEQSLIFVNIKT